MLSDCPFNFGWNTSFNFEMYFYKEYWFCKVSVPRRISGPTHGSFPGKPIFMLKLLQQYFLILFILLFIPTVEAYHQLFEMITNIHLHPFFKTTDSSEGRKLMGWNNKWTKIREKCRNL